MIINTIVRTEEDLDLLCNALNAEAGSHLYSDPYLCSVLIRAQAAIIELEKQIEKTTKEPHYLEYGDQNILKNAT